MANEPLQFGQYYHIYNRGNNRENLFVEQRNYLYFLQLYAKHIQPVAETFAYCLLPNHFHFAIRTFTPEEQEQYHAHQIGSFLQNDPFYQEQCPPFQLREPSRAFNNLFIAYARAFNRATKRSGVLFETPFGRKLVDNDRYLFTLIQYIHRNPQTHGFVNDFRDWPWSSYGAILASKPTKVQRDTVLDWFNGRSHFATAHLTEVDEESIAPILLDDWW